MPIASKYSQIIPAFAILFLTISARSQEPAPKTLPALNQWLKSEHLDQFLQFVTINTSGEAVTVEGRMAGKQNWQNLQKDFQGKNQLSPEEYIFRNVQFQLNTAPANLQINLEGNNAFVFISGDDTAVRSDLQIKMGAAKDTFLIPLNVISALATAKDISGWRSTALLLDKLAAGLKQFFWRYRVGDQPPSYLPISSPAQNKLTITVSRIRKAALETPVSWERYLLIFTVRQQNDKMAIYTIVNGYFGSGIGESEALDYYDLGDHHPEALDLMKTRISGEIQKILTTP